MNRYRIDYDHPHAVSVWVPTLQSAADFLFSFKNSPEFASYRVTDSDSGLVYRAKISPIALSAIELEQVPPPEQFAQWLQDRIRTAPDPKQREFLARLLGNVRKLIVAPSGN